MCVPMCVSMYVSMCVSICVSSGRPRGQDAFMDVTVTLEELYNGATRRIDLNRNVICPKCRGSGAKDGKTKKCKTCNGQGVQLVNRQVIHFHCPITSYITSKRMRYNHTDTSNAQLHHHTSLLNGYDTTTQTLPMPNYTITHF